MAFHAPLLGDLAQADVKGAPPGGYIGNVNKLASSFLHIHLREPGELRAKPCADEEFSTHTVM